MMISTLSTGSSTSSTCDTIFPKPSSVVDFGGRTRGLPYWCLLETKKQQPLKCRTSNNWCCSVGGRCGPSLLLTCHCSSKYFLFACFFGTPCPGRRLFSLLSQGSVGGRILRSTQSTQSTHIPILVLQRTKASNQSAWMSQEVGKRLGSVGYNPNISHLQVGYNTFIQTIY